MLNDTLFFVHGERNSGTNFLEKLLMKNDYRVYFHEINNNICYFWKHGVPNNNIKNKAKKVVEIFIFRKLDSWLKSMWKQPYHLFPIENFTDFLKNNQKAYPDGEILDFRTNKILNDDDNNKNIFEIRYYKYNKIIEYRENNTDIVFVSLEFIQNKDNAYEFIKTLNDKYICDGRKDFICEIQYHTKLNEPIKNREINVNDNEYDEIIDKYKDNNIEEFINNLKFEFK